VVDKFPDYAQVLSYAMPPIENIVPAEQTEELCRLINGRLRRYLREGQGIIFRAGSRRSRSPRPRARRARPSARSRTARSACRPIQHQGQAARPAGIRAFFATMARLGKPVWIHPRAARNFPDYLDEQKSLYEIWWTLGWSYETAAAMSRLVFSKTLDNNPGLKLVMHHFGGIVPMLEGRIGPGWDQIGARTSDADYQGSSAA